MSRLTNWLGAGLLALASLAANAGGPLGVCHGTPTKYPGAGTVTLNYDQGALGSRTKAQADALVAGAVSLWTNVGTATVTLARGTDLPVDVTASNVGSYLDSFTDGRNPIIYDSDGSIIDAVFGIGSRNSVLGVAGSAWYSYSDRCEYAEGQAIISGYLNVSNATMQVTIAHEVGHLIGMDHTQIDTTQGLSSSNYPLMYPIAYRSAVSLHEDDAAAVSALYPHSSVASTYGTVSGYFTLADGVTPVRGANLWAAGSGVFSSVSDYLAQGNGYFQLLLPPGTYTLRAEAISREFTGGSGVGPYSESLSGASFQSPMYSGSTPMAAVTLGGGTPTQITVTAGCAASVAFRINGTGSVNGNCSAATKSEITSPTPGSVLAGSSVTFSWAAGSGVTERYLMVGTSPGSANIYAAYQGTALSRLVSGLPTDGSNVYVRLQSWINGAWQVSSYTYTASTTVATAKSAMTSPTTGSTFGSSSVTFAWNAGSGVTERYLIVGASPGGSDYYAGYQGSALSRTVSTLPTNGSTVYVRLMSWISGGWQSNDYTYFSYTAAATSAPSTITTPAAGSTLTSSSATFSWTAGTGVTERYLAVGSSLGASNYYAGYQGGALSRTVSTLPTNGSAVFVRLMSWIADGWQTQDYTYVASSAGSAKSAMTSPTPGSTLSSSTVMFDWTAGSGVTERYLSVGTTLGGTEVYAGYQGAALSYAVSGLPLNGGTVYVRLYSWISGDWQINDYRYTAATQ